jgi:uncharacterized protein YijF (DUF1287 family)
MLQRSLVVAWLTACGAGSQAANDTPTPPPVRSEVTPTPTPRATPAPSTPVVAAARAQVGVTRSYDPSYVGLDYPGGDVPLDRGVCTDVIIRALRDGYGLDLQSAVHEDMTRDFDAYPANWGLSRPDKNIDHRRVPNLRRYFERQGYSLPIRHDPDAYQPGDLVTCTVPPNLPHIMVVSDRKNRAGTPYVLHNIGQGTREEDRLFEFDITGHYRLPARAPSAP